MHFKFLIYLCIGKVPCTSDMYTVWEKKRATRLPCSGFNGILSFKVDIKVRFMILKKFMLFSNIDFYDKCLFKNIYTDQHRRVPHRYKKKFYVKRNFIIINARYDTDEK